MTRPNSKLDVFPVYPDPWVVRQSALCKVEIARRNEMAITLHRNSLHLECVYILRKHGVDIITDEFETIGSCDGGVVVRLIQSNLELRLTDDEYLSFINYLTSETNLELTREKTRLAEEDYMSADKNYQSFLKEINLDLST